MTTASILACPHEFVGRDAELARLIEAAHASQSLAILAAPGVGATELLRQTFDELFTSESVIPFYFALRRSDRDAERVARRFASDFLTSAVAFLRRDAAILRIAPPVDEISRLAPPEDADWIDAAIDALASQSADPVAQMYAVPARSPRKIAIFIDGLEKVRSIRNGGQIADALRELALAPNVSVIVAGRRRALYGRFDVPHLTLDPLRHDDAIRAIEAIAAARKVEITDRTRDLVAVQLEGELKSIDLLITQAADDGVALTDFRCVETVYTNSILGGRIAKHLRQRILRPLLSFRPKDVFQLLADTLAPPDKRLPVEHWHRRMTKIDDEAFGRLVRHLHVQEVVSADAGVVNMAATSLVVRDWVAAQAALFSREQPRAAVVGKKVLENIARAPRLMTEFYRSNAAIGVRSLLESFDGQPAAIAALDYGLFKHDLKGGSDDVTRASMLTSTETIDLPQIVYTAAAAAFYPSLAELCDLDRSAIGLAETGEAWIVAEIDSKLEADAATTEFWCDRLEMAAVNSGLDRFRIWLIAPEGFADDALDILADRNALGSSRKQAELLKQLINSPKKDAEPATTYDITVAMGDEGEMIVIRHFDEIAAKHEIPKKAAQQIKTALIEAMINAAEHSLSPDKRVELVFTFTVDLITITVTNRGLRLTNHMLLQDDGPSERRGWGLKLIRELMDEVRIEPTDDGTRLVMMKNLP